MPRTSPVYYIAPAAVSITPNANGTPNDLAITVARGTKIKVFYPPIAELGTDNASFQEWILAGRNRSLIDRNSPHTIYARLHKTDHSDAYIVFAPQVKSGDEWTDPYKLSPNTSSVNSINHAGVNGKTYVWGPLPKKQTEDSRSDYWWVKLGTVSAPEDNERTVDFDTGILGTEQYNSEWEYLPDALPLRIDLSCKVDEKELGVNPYVFWGETLRMTAHLVEGWQTNADSMVQQWTISRDTGNADDDASWNNPGGDTSDTDAAQARPMPEGQVALTHTRAKDDFAGAVAAIFTITAWGYVSQEDTSGDETASASDTEPGGDTSEDVAGEPQSSDTTDSTPESEEDSSGEEAPRPLIPLATTTITILAETTERYDLLLSTGVMAYSPQDGAYSPGNGIEVRVRATDQRGLTRNLTNKELRDALLSVHYAAIGADEETELTFDGVDDIEARQTIPVNAFWAGKSLNVRLVNQSGVEFASSTIAFVRNGEDSAYREWIYRRSSSDDYGDAPKLIADGEVNPAGIANSNEQNKNQDGWVPNGWTDEPQGVNSDNPYEFESYRDYIAATTPDASDPTDTGKEGHWGDFSTPKIRNHFGTDGGTPVFRYQWGESAEEPPRYAAEGEGSPGQGWKPNVPDRPNSGVWYLWAISTVQHPGGGYGAWGNPIRLTGDKGDPGDDAADREYIYRRLDSYPYPSNEALPNNIETGTVPGEQGQRVSDKDKTKDDWVPTNWSDNAMPATSSEKYVYFSVREKPSGVNQPWGPFSLPVLWSNWGVQGMDGDGVQYAYKLFDHELTDTERTRYIPSKPEAQNANGEWIPLEWSDDPLSPTADLPFCYCSVIKKINNVWGSFEKLGLWSTYSESSLLIDLDNQMDAFGTDSEGYAITRQEKTTNVQLFYGKSAQVITGMSAVIRRADTNDVVSDTDLIESSVSWQDQSGKNTKTGKVMVIIKAQDLDSDEKKTLTYDLYADITATCDLGSRSARFPLKHISGSAPGVSPTIYQLLPSVSEVVFSKNTAGDGYTPDGVTVKCGFTEATGDTITSHPDEVTAGDYHIYYRTATTGSYTKLTTDGVRVTTSNTFIEFILCANTADTVAAASVTGLIDIETVPVVKDGLNGNDSVRLALDNEHEDFVYDGTGKLVSPSGGATSIIRLYAGNTEVSSFTPVISAVTGTTQGTIQDANGAYIDGHTLHVKDITGSSATVTVKVTYKTVDYYAKFTANKTMQDKYSLVALPNSIAYNAANYKSVSIALSATGIDALGNTLHPTISNSATLTKGNFYVFWAFVKTDGSLNGDLVNLQASYKAVSKDEAATYAGIYFELRRYTDAEHYRLCDYETVEISKSENGIPGESPVSADIDNEMFTVACTTTGTVTTGPNDGNWILQTIFRMFHGSTPLPLTGIRIEIENGGDWGTPSQCSAAVDEQDNTVGRVKLTIQDGDIMDDVATVTVTATAKVDGETVTRQKQITVNSLRPGPDGETPTVYDIMPQVSEVNVGRTTDGGYTPQYNTLRCGYKKIVGGEVTVIDEVSGLIDNTYALFFRRRLRNGGIWESTYYNYTTYQRYLVTSGDSNSGLNVALYDKVEFILYKDTSNGYLLSITASDVIDRETVPVVSDGANNVRLWLNASTQTVKVSADGTVSPSTFFVKLMRTSGSTTTELTEMPENTGIEVFQDGEQIISITDLYDPDGWFNRFRSGNLSTTDFATANVIEFRIRARRTVDIYDSISIATVRDGRNPVRIDLDNQADILAVDSSGKVRFARDVTVVATLYDGATPPSAGVSLPTSGMEAKDLKIGDCTPTVGDLSNGRVSILWRFGTGNTVTPGSYGANISLVYNGQTYTAKFTLAVMDASVIYQLKPSMTEVAFSVGDGNAYVPSSVEVTCEVRKSDGNGTTVINDANANIVDNLYDIYFRMIAANGTYNSDSNHPNGWYLLRANGKARTVLPSHGGIDFALGQKEAWPTPTDAQMIDVENVPVVRDGINGTSPIFADLDNEMDSMACDANGLTTSEQFVNTTVSMFLGNVKQTIESIACAINGVTLGDSYTSDNDPRQFFRRDVNTSSGLVVIKAKQGTALDVPVVVVITVAAQIAGATVTRQLKMTINGVLPGLDGKPATIYNIKPQVSEVNVGRNAAGGYIPQYNTVRCGYTKHVGDTVTFVEDSTGTIDDAYRLFFRRRLRSTGEWESTYYYYNYAAYNRYLVVTSGSSISGLDAAIYDKVEFILYRDKTNDSLTNITPSNVIDRETVPVVSDGLAGLAGDTPLQAYRWYKAGMTPVTPTDLQNDVPQAAANDSHSASDVYPTDTWSATAPNRPADGWELWMTNSVKRTSGGSVTRDAWSIPVRISGAHGAAGEDAKERKWIYRRGSTPQIPSTPTVPSGTFTRGGGFYEIISSISDTPSTDYGDTVLVRNSPNIYEWTEGGNNGEDGLVLIGTAALGEVWLDNVDDEYYYWNGGSWVNSGSTAPTGAFMDYDDYVPAGWTDDAQGVTSEQPYEFASFRAYDTSAKTWKPYETPVLWSHYGHNGMDGAGIEHVFVRTKNNVKPYFYGYAQTGNKDSYGTAETADEHLPLVRIGSGSAGDIIGNTNYNANGYNGIVAECTDDPVGVDNTYKYEWVLTRSKLTANANGVRPWATYRGYMALWAKWSTDADLWTIGEDGYWYKNGVKTNVLAEGHDGTGIELKGTVDVLFEDDKTGTQTSLEGVTNASVGDCYMVRANGWLYFYDGTSEESEGSGDTPANPQGWRPVGRLKGEPGENKYIHIAYAMDITIEGGTVTSVTDFAVTKMRNDYTYIGICVNNTEEDPGAGATTDEEKVAAANRYQWNYMRGTNGTSPWMADIDNEMDSVLCGINGRPKTVQTLTTTVRLWHGSTKEQFYLDAYEGTEDDANAFTSGIAKNGVTVSWTSGEATEKIVTVEVATTAQFATTSVPGGKKVVCLKLTPTASGAPAQLLYFTINASMPGPDGEPATVYNLQPSLTEISVSRTSSGDYTPETVPLTCGVAKWTGKGEPEVTPDATGVINALYRVYYRRRIRAGAVVNGETISSETWESYYRRYGHTAYRQELAAGLDIKTYNAVEFVLCKNNDDTVSVLTEVVDRETVPVVADGKDGAGSVKLDLDNETETLLYDDSGKNVSGQATAQAYLYDGANDVTNLVESSDWAIASHSNNIQTSDSSLANYATISDSGAVTVTGIGGSESGFVIVRATYNGTNYYAKMTLHKQIGGSVYRLVFVSGNHIIYNTSTQLPATTEVTVKIMKLTVGGVYSVASPPSGYSLIFCTIGENNRYVVAAGGNKGNVSEATFKVSDVAAMEELRVVIGKVLPDGGVNYINEASVLDSEVIPVTRVKDGEQGPSVQVVIEPSPILFDTASDGIGRGSKAFTVSMKIDGNPATLDSITGITSSATGVVVKASDDAGENRVTEVKDINKKSKTLYAHVINEEHRLDGYITFNVEGKLNGKDYKAMGTVATGANKQGPTGPGGKDAPTVTFDPQVILFSGNESGKVTNGATQAFKVEMYVGGAACKISKIENITPSSGRLIVTNARDNTVGVTSWSSNDNVVYAVNLFLRVSAATTTVDAADINGSVSMKVTGTGADGKSYVSVAHLPVGVTYKGDPGLSITGETGPMFYPMGEWSQDNTPYTRTSGTPALIPFVHVDGPYNPNTGKSGDYYYLNAASSSAQPGTNSDWIKAAWFGLTITDGVFADFARLGSAVISKDWLYSANGTINGTAYDSTDVLNPAMFTPHKDDVQERPAYTYFDARFPQGVGSKVIPLINDGKREFTKKNEYGDVTDGIDVLGGVTYKIEGTFWKEGNDFIMARVIQKVSSEAYFVEQKGQSNEYDRRSVKQILNENEAVWLDKLTFTPSETCQVFVQLYSSAEGTTAYIANCILTLADENNNAFVPNYAVDLLTGKMIAARGNFIVEQNGNVFVEGRLNVKSMETTFIDLTDKYVERPAKDDKKTYIKLDGQNAEYILGEPVYEEYKKDGETTYTKVDTSGIYHFTVAQTKFTLPSDKKYIGQRVLIYNGNLNVSGGTSRGVIIEACIFNEEGLSVTLLPFRGIGIQPKNNNDPIPSDHALPSNTATPSWSFSEVKSIYFVNGTVEVIGVPDTDNPNNQDGCAWAVVNIGTNCYLLEGDT